MTPETLIAITDSMIRWHHSCECGDYCEYCAPWACGASSQQIMDYYLRSFTSDAEYQTSAKHRPEFFAVLATEEYHRHWETPAGGSPVIRCRRCNGTVVYKRTAEGFEIYHGPCAKSSSQGSLDGEPPQAE